MNELPQRVNAIDLSREERKTLADMKKLEAAELVALSSIETVKFFYDVMHDETQDIQARLRAADILMSRQIPKVAARHVQEDPNVVESSDVVAIREHLVEEFKKNAR